MSGHGRISAVYSVHCGQCGHHFTPQGTEQMSAAGCAGVARRAGWALTRYRGWVCGPCNAVGFAGGPAGRPTGEGS